MSWRIRYHNDAPYEAWDIDDSDGRELLLAVEISDCGGAEELIITTPEDGAPSYYVPMRVVLELMRGRGYLFRTGDVA